MPLIATGAYVWTACYIVLCFASVLCEFRIWKTDKCTIIIYFDNLGNNSKLYIWILNSAYNYVTLFPKNNMCTFYWLNLRGRPCFRYILDTFCSVCEKTESYFDKCLCCFKITGQCWYVGRNFVITATRTSFIEKSHWN